MKENHIQLNLAKTELLVFPATPTLQHDFTIQLGSSTITPSTSVRNLYWPTDLQRAHCNDCLILQVCTTQHQKDQALSDRACFTTSCPKESMLHLSLSPCTGYQLQLASSSRHWCLHIKQPQAQHPPTSTPCYESTSPPEAWDLLVSVALWYHHREAQNHFPEHSHSPFLAGGMIFPPPSGTLDPSQSSSNNWKLISFNTTWLHPKLKKYLSLSFSPFLASLYLFEQCLRLGVTSTSSVCLPLQDESLYVFPNCKSLWIKASGLQND